MRRLALPRRWIPSLAAQSPPKAFHLDHPFAWQAPSDLYATSDQLPRRQLPGLDHGQQPLHRVIAHRHLAQVLHQVAEIVDIAP